MSEAEAPSNVVRFRHPLDGDFVQGAHFALAVAVLYWDEERWTQASIAAAMALAPELGRIPTPQRWTEILDAIEDAVAPILRELELVRAGGPRLPP